MTSEGGWHPVNDGPADGVCNYHPLYKCLAASAALAASCPSQLLPGEESDAISFTSSGHRQPCCGHAGTISSPVLLLLPCRDTVAFWG